MKWVHFCYIKEKFSLIIQFESLQEWETFQNVYMSQPSFFDNYFGKESRISSISLKDNTDQKNPLQIFNDLIYQNNDYT